MDLTRRATINAERAGRGKGTPKKVRFFDSRGFFYILVRPHNHPLAHLRIESALLHMHVPLGTVIIYARDMHRTAAFYSKHFGFKTTGEISEGLIELHAPSGGAGILIHQAAKSVKLGQVGVKLSFQVPDVATFAAEAAKRGLNFGAVHQANGYSFANAKDPDKNSVNISSRVFRARATV
jgi:predicted enzyme related to lactoylglutathione lyase